MTFSNTTDPTTAQQPLPLAGTPTPPANERAAFTKFLTQVSHPIPDEVDPLLSQILGWPRSHKSGAELAFRFWLTAEITKRLGALAPNQTLDTKELKGGTLYAVIYEKDGKQPTTLFSSHMDTMDQAKNCVLTDNTYIGKDIVYDKNLGTIHLAKDPASGSCLGADDGVGVWMMLYMMEKGIPGGYAFNAGEECGCDGSRGMVDHHPDILRKYEVAVAFDRPRTNEVITHQGGVECCSKKFADSLCGRLNHHGLDFAPSNRGVLTDTKHWRGIIAECTNIGVGYENQHGRDEWLDYGHALALRNVLVEIEWNSLVVDRDPTFKEPMWDSGFNNYRDFGGSYSPKSWMDRNSAPKLAKAPPAKKGPKKGTKKKSSDSAGPPVDYAPPLSAFDEIRMCSINELVMWIEDAPPADVADTVIQLVMEIGRLRSDVAIQNRFLEVEVTDYQ